MKKNKIIFFVVSIVLIITSAIIPTLALHHESEPINEYQNQQFNPDINIGMKVFDGWDYITSSGPINNSGGNSSLGATTVQFNYASINNNGTIKGFSDIGRTANNFMYRFMVGPTINPELARHYEITISDNSIIIPNPYYHVNNDNMRDKVTERINKLIQYSISINKNYDKIVDNGEVKIKYGIYSIKNDFNLAVLQSSSNVELHNIAVIERTEAINKTVYQIFNPADFINAYNNELDMTSQEYLLISNLDCNITALNYGDIENAENHEMSRICITINNPTTFTDSEFGTVYLYYLTYDNFISKNTVFNAIVEEVNFSDFNLIDWLIDLGNSILSLEITKGIVIGNLLWFIIGIGVLFFILKTFAGG